MDKVLSNIRTKSESGQVIACLDEISFSLFSAKEDSLKQEYFAHLHKELADSLNELLGQEPVNDANREKIKRLIHDLQEQVKKCKIVQMTIAFQPDEATLSTFSSWIKEHVGKDFVLDVHLDRTIIGGAVIVANGLYKDFSLKQKVANVFQIEREKFLPPSINTMKTFNIYLKQTEEIGFVEECNHAIVYVSGLPNATIQEIVMFETGELGMVLSLSREHAEILLFSKYSVKVGTKAVRTDSKQQMPVGFELLGQTVNPFGAPLEASKNFVPPTLSRPIDNHPTGISTRKPIKTPFETGVTVVDFLVPLGRGQRELIIGDRKTGKTSFLHQTILKQTRQGTICVYAAIGKKKTDIKKTEDFFKSSGIEKNTVIIASGSEDPTGITYLTPYAAMTLAEYFRDEGHDVLVVMDDLFTHAKFYREIMLIGKRFPGRNAYPPDIFYTHARLLERAGNFVINNGDEHSITCLPIVESVEGDIAGFIQTNLMSMTDGHIYFDPDLFTKGQRPAVNPFLSVSRVGRQTQSSLRLTLNRELISFLTVHQRLENFSHFGSETGPMVKRTLTVGSHIFSFFTQAASEVRDLNLEIILFGLLWQETWHSIEKMEQDMKKVRENYQMNPEAQELVKHIIDNAPSLNDLLARLNENKDKLAHLFGISLEPTLPSAPAPQPMEIKQEAAQTPEAVQQQ